MQASRPSSSLPPLGSSSSRFHVPFEHGAWWSFGSSLLGGAAVALARRADAWACLGLGVSLAAGFVAQDWGQALIAWLIGRRSQALSQWQAPQGWALAGLALGGAALLIGREGAGQRLQWLLLLGVLGLAAAAGLTGRILQSGRGRKSLAATALLLAAPALPFGVLAFGFVPRAFAFWAWPLAFYPAATLAAQSYIRGFPERARWAGPALAAWLGALALVLGAWVPGLSTPGLSLGGWSLGLGGMVTDLDGPALGWKAGLPGLLLLAQAARLHLAICTRWRQHPQGLPPGTAIRSFGREQAFFGVTLTLLWAWAFAHL